MTGPSSIFPALTLCLVMAGCGCSARPHTPPVEDEPEPQRPASDESETDGARGSAANEEPAVSEEPALGPISDDGSRRVRFDVDGVTIVGRQWPPSGPNQPAVILAHQLGSTHDEWSSLVEALRREQPSWGILAIDMRGHGASLHRSGEAISFREFTRQEWRELPGDVEGSLRFLRSEAGEQPAAVGLVGSSIGSSACLLALAREVATNAVEAPPVGALVMLSPGLDYHGLETSEAAATAAAIPTLAFAARGDRPSATAIAALAERSPNLTPRPLAGDAHGVRMAEENEQLQGEIIRFLSEQLMDEE